MYTIREWRALLDKNQPGTNTVRCNSGLNIRIHRLSGIPERSDQRKETSKEFLFHPSIVDKIGY